MVTGYQKKYRVRMAIPGRNSTEVTFPFEVVEKEARAKGMSVEKFLSRHYVVAEYDNFDGVIYRFQELADATL